MAVTNIKPKSKSELEFERICAVCETAVPIEDDDFVLCSKKGIVSAKGHCRKFVYDLLKRNPGRSPQMITLDKEALDISDL